MDLLALGAYRGEVLRFPWDVCFLRKEYAGIALLEFDRNHLHVKVLGIQGVNIFG